MDLLTNTLAFVFALGVIIFVHEAGHYLVAKSFGVRVLTFSLGFGRKIFGFTRGEKQAAKNGRPARTSWSITRGAWAKRNAGKKAK